MQFGQIVYNVVQNVEKGDIMSIIMAKKKKEPKRYPSRENTRYVALPLSMYEILESLGAREERSTSWIARKAIREFLERQKLLPPQQET
jgi:hypothetical protein